MFKRVMVAVVGIPFLILVLGVAPEWATMLLVCGMCGVGAWELMHAVAGEAGKSLIPLSVLSAVLVPVCVYMELSIRYAKLTALPALPLTCLLYTSTQVCILNEEGRVERMIAAHDVGKAVNPTSVEGQIEGGVVMSLGYALTERYPLTDCKPTAKFGTLGLFRANQIPEITPIIVEKPGLNVACGAIGIGEITSIPTAPAVADAYSVSYTHLDLLGTGASLTTVAGEPLLNIVLMTLVVCGGLGFLVWDDILTHRFHFSKWRLHSKIAFTGTLMALVLGTVAFFILEEDHAFAGVPTSQQLSLIHI